MTKLKSLVKTLKNSGFVQIGKKVDDAIPLKCNENAYVLKNELENFWQKTTYPNCINVYKEQNSANQKYRSYRNTCHIPSDSPFKFLNSQGLLESLKFFPKTITKTNQHAAVQHKIVEPVLNQNLSNFHLNLSKNTLMITDFLTTDKKGLQFFYNIQRARKIWWMLLSTNPSRYYLEPYEMKNEELLNLPNGCQAITIRSKFFFNDFPMEEITLTPVSNLFGTYLPEGLSLVRSTITSNTAVCAILLDACDHSRGDVLLLNRKLAPYQCVITVINEDATHNRSLRNLALHLSNVIKKAGLRLYDFDLNLKHRQQHDDDLRTFDANGIPYTLILLDTTLINGLLKLRNRDTSLEETIHISDLPYYLLNIFK